MKKYAIKFLSLMVFAAMCLSMMGMGLLSDDEVVGMYTMEFDMTEMAVALFDEGTGMADVLSIGDYLTEFKLKINYEMRDDLTYSISMDKNSYMEALDSFRTAAIPFFDDIIFISLVETLAEDGVVIDSREDLEAMLGMDYEDIYLQILGASLEDIVDELLAEAFSEETIEAGFAVDGNYIAIGGKLYTSMSLDEKPNMAGYEEYSFEDGKLIITAGENIAESELGIYPMVLERLEEDDIAA